MGQRILRTNIAWLVSMFTAGPHHYQIVGDAIPEDAKITGVFTDIFSDEISIRLESSEWSGPLPQCETLMIRPVIECIYGGPAGGGMSYESALVDPFTAIGVKTAPQSPPVILTSDPSGKLDPTITEREHFVFTYVPRCSTVGCTNPAMGGYTICQPCQRKMLLDATTEANKYFMNYMKEKAAAEAASDKESTWRDKAPLI